MLKKWVGLTCVAILLVIICLLVWRQPADIHSEASSVLVTQAEAINQGVQVVWLEAQSSHHATSGYVIEKSRGHSDFIRIAHVEKESLQYLDAEGRSGDRYRIIAEGGQHSKPSEPITAVPPKPGSNIVVATLPSSQVLGSTTHTKTDTPINQATSLKSAIETAFRHLDTTIKDGNFAEAASYLHALQGYQHESLILLPKLLQAEKASLVQACADHAANLETSLHILPADNQMDGMLVEAGCDAMHEAAL